MRRFRYLPHTADVRFAAYGADFSEALENAALALLNIMLDLKRVKSDGSSSRSIRIRESADTDEEIVWFALQDILSKVDAMKLNAYSFKVESLARGRKIRLAGRLVCKRSREDHSMMSVKAVTPHGLQVRRTGRRVSIGVVVDV